MRYRFSDCILDDELITLTRGGVIQPLEPQVFDLLHLLVRNAGSLVSRDQIMDEIWVGRIVSDSAVSARIAAVRRAVGDNGKTQSIIRTVSRRGLQFVAKVTFDETPDTAVPRKDTEAIIRYATADDGTKIAFAVSGDGPPLLRLGHFPSHLELEWQEATERAMFDAFSAHHTLIRMDFRGSGLSDLDAQDFSLTQCAKDACAIADELGLEQFSVFGSSSGGRIAVELAALAPERVQGVVILGGYVEGRSIRADTAGAGKEDVFMTMVEAGWDTPESAFISGYLSVYFPTASQELIQILAHNVQNSCPKENELRGREAGNHYSIAPLLSEVKAPTLVMHCRGDAAHPLEQGQKIARGIAGAQFRVLESRNHYPLPDEPSWQILINSTLQFLRENANST